MADAVSDFSAVATLYHPLKIFVVSGYSCIFMLPSFAVLYYYPVPICGSSREKVNDAAAGSDGTGGCSAGKAAGGCTGSVPTYTSIRQTGCPGSSDTCWTAVRVQWASAPTHASRSQRRGRGPIRRGRSSMPAATRSKSAGLERRQHN